MRFGTKKERKKERKKESLNRNLEEAKERKNLETGKNEGKKGIRDRIMKKKSRIKK